MARIHYNTDKILDEILAVYGQSPIDLLDINDGNGEYLYLLNARTSYLRTIKDIADLFQGRRQAADDSLQEISILEVGSYLGPVSITLAKMGFSVTAADIPEFMNNPRLQKRYRQSGVTTLSLDLKNNTIPVVSAEFDIVVMCETLEHLNFNPLPVLAEINRVLKKGGYLYISLPNLASLVNRVKLLFGHSIFNPIDDFFAQLRQDRNMIVGIHWREYTRDELEAMLTRTGFRVISHYFFTNTRSQPFARLLYHLIPQLRPNQTAIVIKEEAPELLSSTTFLGNTEDVAGLHRK